MKINKFLISTLIMILIFFSFTKVQANFFTDDWDENPSEIEETIENDEGRII